MLSGDPLWYKDAVVYQVHIKSYRDSNADGFGDFRGLMEKLDYIESLGVNCIWLLPFYPSPLRDDGYDIAQYEAINPQYGTLDDFRAFMDEAHRRGIRVITELVINHTSDQHPWFQRARRAAKDSPERRFYVWSDDPHRYSGTRIIFTDTETSNWSWDPVAEQFYWHRFFSHQPDLNFDNPEVRAAVMDVMRFWLRMGVDGLRLDAVPYLVEREGTNCENLPETHDVLKEMRAALDAEFEGRIFLAEANQWPDDVRPYFGDGDECHMAFHFPVMPRMYMALRKEDRTPLVDIMERTPEIPSDCQWAIFLRNHDELTLEMVTDEERDYMYREYARDPRMRINVGIRRRLAPLLDNGRRQIELMNALLMSLPGTPIVYYGDEIGMGDNTYLGDRNGVRTPMQWNAYHNAGFSAADNAALFAPLIVDMPYGYQAVNVNSQERTQTSLMRWMRRLIKLRKEHRAFGRGTWEPLDPENKRVLVYLRRYEDEVILCVNNLSRYAQYVELDLREFEGCIPYELYSGSPFSRIGEMPYLLTLGPHTFFWFQLRRSEGREEQRPAQREPESTEMRAAGAPSDAAVRELAEKIDPEWLRRQRWFRGKAREITRIEAEALAPLMEEKRDRSLLGLLRVQYEEGDSDRYLLPLIVHRGDGATIEQNALATLPGTTGVLRLFDGSTDPEIARALLRLIRGRAELPAGQGSFAASSTPALPATASERQGVRPLGAEQSNTSLVFGDTLLLKTLRKVEEGENPDLEIPRFLTLETSFRSIPEVLGWIEYRSDEGWSGTVATLVRFIPSRGDGWQVTLQHLREFYGRARREPADTDRDQRARALAAEYLEDVRALGRTTAAMHEALISAGPDHPDFQPVPLSPEDVERLQSEMRDYVTRVLSEAGTRLEHMPAAFSSAAQENLRETIQLGATLRNQLAGLAQLKGSGMIKARHHGDYHLGQVLRASDASKTEEHWIAMDFEGEPARPLAERREKQLPMRDVAGMLRSFDYAAQVGLREWAAAEPDSPRETMQLWAEAWERVVREAFLHAYRERAAGSPLLPRDPQTFDRVLAAFELEKAVYELHYELNNRPDWVGIPLMGIRRVAGVS